MFSKILNSFEILLLLLILNGFIREHYGHSISGPFFYNDNLGIRVLLDTTLGSAIFLRLKDLILNFNQKVASPKKFYLPLILYSIAILPDFWHLFRVSSYFSPILITIVFIQFSLPIFILSGRILFTQKQLKIGGDAKDILDLD